MTSKIKADNLNKVSDDSTIIKKCGSTTTVGSGSGQTIVVDGATITLGRCGGTVSLASGATQSGFGRSGSVNWCTTIKTSPLTSESGKGYFINTAGGAVTVTLPSGPSVGDIVAVADAGRSAACNAITIGRNSQKIDNLALCGTICTSGGAATLVYTGSCNGWKTVADTSANLTSPLYITATGGNAITTCGNFKTHIFTSGGNFAVTASETTPNNIVEYVVIGGGAGGAGGNYNGGGGAGGFRIYSACASPNPLNGPAALPVTTQSYPITIGAGGGAAPPCSQTGHTAGNASVFSTISSAGGGIGGTYNPSPNAGSGASGGGGGSLAGSPMPGGSGNTPPTAPPQGNDGGNGTCYGPGGTTNHRQGGGGGGGGTAGQGTTTGLYGGDGGTGSFIPDGYIGPTAPSYGTPGPASSVRYFSGGGGGGLYGGPGPGGDGGAGGGGSGGYQFAFNATANTGGGGGGGIGHPAPTGPGGPSGVGGSGIVMIRYRFQ